MRNSPEFIRAVDVREHWADFCHHVFRQIIDSVHPIQCLPAAIPDLSVYSAVNVISVGKGAAAMADAFVAAAPGIRLRGIVAAPHGVALSEMAGAFFDLYSGAHPVPDEGSLAAALAALECAASTTSDELLLVLLTGGASALMCCPLDGVSLQEKQDVVNALLRSGVPIQDMNAVRRMLSQVKGGALLRAALYAKHVCTLAISDVVNDDPRYIGSGPTVAVTNDEYLRAQTLLREHGFAHLVSKLKIPVDTRGLSSSYEIIGSSKQALTRLKDLLVDVGFAVFDLGGDCEGEAQTVAADHAEQVSARIQAEQQLADQRPLAFVSGGELTVQVRGEGQGGPNQEYALTIMLALDDPDIHILAFDTDGKDGVGEAAGAYVDSKVRHITDLKRLKPREYLANSDSGSFFMKTGGHFVTGLSGTNVNDVRLICWFPKSDN